LIDDSGTASSLLPNRFSLTLPAVGTEEPFAIEVDGSFGAAEPRLIWSYLIYDNFSPI